MLTFQITGEIDREKWESVPPDGSRASRRNQWVQMKSVSKQLRRYGMKGHTKAGGSPKQPGYSVILQFLYAKFPDVTPENKALGYRGFPSEPAVYKWTNDIPFAPDDPAYSPEAVPRQWRSYVARLSLISEFWRDRPLTGKEAVVAEYVGNEFQDPLGKQVDLLPQLAVVRTLASAEQDDDAEQLQSFERYFTYAPWESGRDFYEDKIGGLEDAMILPDFMLFMNKSEKWQQKPEKRGWRDVSPVYEDALRQLGMPYTGFWYDLGEDGVRDIRTASHYGDASKGKCDWKTILNSRTPEEQEEASRTYATPLEELAYLTDNPLLEPLLVSETWKQIERIYEEKSND